MKSYKIIWLLIILFCNLYQGCSELTDLVDPANKDNKPKSLEDYASLSELATQALADGKVPSYSASGGNNGLISLGDSNGCVVMVSGKLKCWGRNDFNQLGDGTTTNSNSPILATSVNPGSGDILVSVSLGRTSSCAYYYSGLKCWGNQNNGVLGNGVTVGSASTPQSVTNANGKTVRAIQMSDFFSCIFDATGQVFCWGLNDVGQLGDGTTTNTTTGTTVLLGKTAIQFISHNKTSCALLNDRTLKCWGSGYGSTPVLINTSSTVKSVGGGNVFPPFFTCAVLTDSRVQCFGVSDNSKGEYGNGSNTAPSSSTQAVTVVNSSGATLQEINMVAAGAGYHSACAVTGDYTSVYCWGSGTNGGLGNGNTANSNTAVQVTKTWPNSTIIDISVTDNRACILLKNEDVWCWGGGIYGHGELGNGVAVGSTTVPIKILNRNDS